MSVLSLADAKSHLNITVATYDTELQVFVDAAEAAVAKRTGGLTAVAATARVRGDTDRLLLSTLPVISLTSVTPVDGTALTVADLTVSASGVVEFLLGGWFGSRFYDVAYQAGRAVVPADLLMAVKETARHLWATQRGGQVRKPGSEGEQLVAAAYAFTHRVRELWGPHVQHGFA